MAVFVMIFGHSLNAYDIPRNYIGAIAMTSEGSSVTLSWTTLGNAVSQVYYGETDRYTYTTEWTTTPSTEHSVTLTRLNPDTTYHYKIRVYEEGLGDVFTAETEDLNFTTDSLLSISDIAVMNANSSTVAITFTTSIASQSIIEYGLTESFGSSKTSDDSTTDHSFTLTSLLPSTTYYFRITAITEGAMAISETSNFTTTESTSHSNTPPTQVTNIGIRALSEDSVSIEWSPSSDDVGVYSYTIFYAQGTLITQEMIDTNDPRVSSVTLLTDSQCNPDSPSYTHTGLTQETTYYYRIIATDSEGNTSPISTSASTLINRSSTNTSGCTAPTEYTLNDSQPPKPPKNVRAASLDKEVQLFWKNGTDSDFVRTIVVRKKIGYPTNPKDGEVIYSGIRETFSDTELENERTYFYSFFTEDSSSNFSLPVTLSISPRGGITNIHVVTTLDDSTKKSPQLKISRTYKKGDTSEDIEHLQELLASQPTIYPEGYTTGFFGILTENAVKRFQEIQKLTITGEFDKPTIEVLLKQNENKYITLSPFKIGAVTLSRTLKRGMKGNDVRYLQEFLISEKLLHEHSVSGIFGPMTEKAVKDFQFKMNISPQSGFVGEKTRSVIQKIIEQETLHSELLSWIHIPEVAGWFSAKK